jgi:hypothetical protein
MQLHEMLCTDFQDTPMLIYCSVTAVEMAAPVPEIMDTPRMSQIYLGRMYYVLTGKNLYVN